MEESFLYLTLNEKRRLRLVKIIEKNPDRFLFGTDLIVTDHPQKNHAWLDLMGRGYLGWLSTSRFEHGFPKLTTYRGLGLSEETRRMVFSTNFRRLILDEDDPEAVPEGGGELEIADDLRSLSAMELRIYGCAAKSADDDDDDDDADDDADDDDDDTDDDDDDWDDDDDE